MNPETSLSLSLIFAIVAVIGTFVSIFNNIKNNRDKETEKQMDIEKKFIHVNDKLDVLSTNLSELIRRDEINITELKRINETLILQNERLEALFRYKDEHERRIKNLENKRRK